MRRISEDRLLLHEAAEWCRKEIAELLIAKGADVNAKNKYGKTPLDKVVVLAGANLRYAEATDLLHKHGGKTGEALKAE